MTVTSRKQMLDKVFEHFCNNDAEAANELLHQYIVETARSLYSDMTAEDSLHEEALEADMESDLASDLEDIHGEAGDEEEGHADHADAEEDLATDMLGDDDMEASEEGSFEDDDSVDGDHDDLEAELHAHEEGDEEEGEEIEDRVEDLEAEFEELKKAFDDLADEDGDQVDESVNLEPVTVKSGVREIGSGSSGIGIDSNAKAPFSKVDNTVKIGGEPVAIGKGAGHKGFDRQQAPTSKELGKMTNRVKSSKEVLKAVGNDKSGYLVNDKKEVGSGKSGVPVEGNTKSVL